MSEYDARLAQRVSNRGWLTPDEAAGLLLPVADGLVPVHDAGHVHGAISPESVVLDDGGQPRLLARADVTADPEFTAPEVAAGARPTAAADVWSLAAVLHHAATGRAPYSGPVGPRAGGWLRPVLQLSLSTEPSDRPTMAELGDYLRARLAPATATTRRMPAPTNDPSGQRRTSLAPVLLGAAVVALLAVVGAGLLLLGGGEDPGTAGPATTSTPRSESDSKPARSGRSARVAGPPTANQLARFARTYVFTASADPDRGFRRLTRAYQLASPRYREVWSAIEDPRILSVEPEPQHLMVSYTYTYRLPDGRQQTEDVTLRLVQRGGRLLIAGATARPL